MGKKGKKKGTSTSAQSGTRDNGSEQAPHREEEEEDIPEDCACCGTIFGACATLSIYTCAGILLITVILLSAGAVDMGFGDSEELRAWREVELTELYIKEKNSTYLRKRTIQVEVLSASSPKVWLVPGFLSARECEFVREVYGPWLHTCDAVGRGVGGGGVGRGTRLRSDLDFSIRVCRLTSDIDIDPPHTHTHIPPQPPHTPLSSQGMYSRFQVSSGQFQKIPKPTCRKLETSFTPKNHKLLDTIGKRIARIAGENCYRREDCRVSLLEPISR